MNYKASIGPLQENYSARGYLLSYSLFVKHDGLRKGKVVKAASSEVVAGLATMLAAEWDNQWSVLSERERSRMQTSDNQEAARIRTEEAQNELNALQNLIASTLEVNDAIDWDTLKISGDYPEARPEKKRKPNKPKMTELDPEPNAKNPRYSASVGILDKLIGRVQKKEAEAAARFNADHTYWSKTKKIAEEAFTNELIAYENECKKIDNDYAEELACWDARNSEFLLEKSRVSDKIDQMRGLYLAQDPKAIMDYCELVLARSSYPDCFPKEFDLEYTPTTKTLLIDYLLPYIDDLPKLKEVKYIQSKKEFQEKNISQPELNRLYDDVIYQTILRTIHEIFESDVVNAIDSVVINGIVQFVDKSSGHDSSATIVSLQAQKDEFLAINIGKVDPKACFKTLKGVGSAKLHGISPIAPIITMRKEDGRFISAQEVVNSLDDSTNLAAMDWQEFEHLIRELFEKEFSVNGGDRKSVV